MKIGYARVSTGEQNLDLQIDALRAANCDQIFTDKGISAIASVRPGYEGAIDALRGGDVFVIWKIDRAFRSTVDAILVLEALRRRGIEFQCITMNIDTTTPDGRKWYRDTASWAEYERELISERTKAGLEAARRRGKRLGRPPALTREQTAHARREVDAGRETMGGMAEILGVDRGTLRRAFQRWEPQAMPDRRTSP